MTRLLLTEDDGDAKEHLKQEEPFHAILFLLIAKSVLMDTDTVKRAGKTAYCEDSEG